MAVSVEIDDLGPELTIPEKWPESKRLTWSLDMMSTVARTWFKQDIERGLEFIEKAESLGIWEWARCSSMDEYLTRFGLNTGVIARYRDGVGLLKKGGHTGKITQKDIGIHLADTVEPIADHGEIGRGEERANNVISNRQHGNNAEYTAARLKRDSPELLEKVRTGELTLNQAAIKAGFRPRMVSVRLDDPEKIINTLKNKMTDKQYADFLRYMREFMG